MNKRMFNLNRGTYVIANIMPAARRILFAASGGFRTVFSEVESAMGPSQQEEYTEQQQIQV
jgi:hypothetical protein